MQTRTCGDRAPVNTNITVDRLPSVLFAGATEDQPGSRRLLQGSIVADSMDPATMLLALRASTMVGSRPRAKTPHKSAAFIFSVQPAFENRLLPCTRFRPDRFAIPPLAEVQSIRSRCPRASPPPGQRAPQSPAHRAQPVRKSFRPCSAELSNSPGHGLSSALFRRDTACRNGARSPT